MSEIPHHTSGSKAGAIVDSKVAEAAAAEGKYDKIPGPLGIQSASLAGKIALVTGAGTCCLL